MLKPTEAQIPLRRLKQQSLSVKMTCETSHHVLNLFLFTNNLKVAFVIKVINRQRIPIPETGTGLQTNQFYESYK